MRLKIKNIGKIKEADIELGGITVIAGENDTGKSTVSKALYSVFNSYYKLEEQVRREREEIVESALDPLLFRKSVGVTRAFRWEDTAEIAKKIIPDLEQYAGDRGKLKKFISDAVSKYWDEMDENRYTQDEDDSALSNAIFSEISDELLDSVLSKIDKAISISEKEIAEMIISKKFQSEFSGQVNSLHTDEKAEVILRIREKDVSIEISDNSVVATSDLCYLNTEVLYLDDPFVLDAGEDYSMRSFRLRRRLKYIDHREHLQEKIFKTESEGNVIAEKITNDKLEAVYLKLNTVCSGEVVRSKRRGFGYQLEKTDKVLNFKNLSAGLKGFVILKTLLQNGVLEENGTVILDEPEIHLHPEWQLIFAELILLLQKEFNLHVLLNTHSPYFLNAIEVFAEKYEMAETCRYYLASLEDSWAVFEDVSGNREKIYQKLAGPFQKLEDIRYAIDD